MVPHANLEFGPYVLTPAARSLTKDGIEVAISSRALELLIALVEKPGEVIQKADLIARAWPDVTVEEGGLRVQIVGLRKALQDGRYIRNVPGRGYCFVGEVRGNAPAASHEHRTQIATRCGRPRLIGREEDVALLVQQVLDRRFVDIVGPGGIGKTSVAYTAFADLQPMFPQGAHMVDLAVVSDPGLVGTAIAEALGVEVRSDDPIAAILSFLGDGRRLLLLDNCEHVIEFAAIAAERIFAGGPGTHILATSRETLRAAGEQVFLLPPLACPDDGETGPARSLADFPAVALFLDRALASGASGSWSDAELEAAAFICRHMDGIALAIELAAGRARTFGIVGTADLIANRFWLNWQGRRTAQPRHQTLAAMLDWSFRLLGPVEQNVLLRIAIFTGSFSLGDVEHVMRLAGLNRNEVVEALGELVGKSLVQPQLVAGEPTYRLLESTRAFALAELEQTGEWNSTAASLAGLVCLKLGRHQEELFSAQGDEDKPVELLANLRMSLRWAFDPDGERKVALELAVLGAPLLLRMSMLVECERWANAALSMMAPEERGGQRELVLLEAIAISAMFTRGNSDDVGHAIRDGLVMAEGLEDRMRRMRLLAGLNIFVIRQGRFAEALDAGTSCLEVAAQIGTPEAIATAEWMIGVSQHLRGRQDLACSHCERGLAIWPGSNLGRDAILFGYNHRMRARLALSRALWLSGRPDAGCALASALASDASFANEAVNACIAFVYTAPVLLWSGRFEEAERITDQLIAFATAHSLGPYRATGLAQRAELLMLRGELAEGIAQMRAALRMLADERHDILSPSFLRALGYGLMQIGSLAEARNALAAALGACSSEGAYDLPEMQRLMGEACARDGERDDAVLWFEKASRTAQSAGASSLDLRVAISEFELGPDGRRAERLRSARHRIDGGKCTPDVERADQLLGLVV